MEGRNKTVGAWGEDQACRFLIRQGFSIIERNYHTTVGEIDIVATKLEDYYFVEVKTRQAGALAYDTAVTEQKRRKLAKTINHYCYHRSISRDNVSLVTASLMVVINKIIKTVSFRLAVLY